jgi:hypothetical protein
LGLAERRRRCRVALVNDRATNRAAIPEGMMPTKQHGQIVETPTEARQAEPGPSMLAVLIVSTIALIFVFAIVWFLFFRT